MKFYSLINRIILHFISYGFNKISICFDLSGRCKNVRYGLDRLHALTKTRDCNTIFLKCSIRQISDFQIGNPAEGWPPQLFPHIGFPLVRRNKEQSLQSLRL